MEEKEKVLAAAMQFFLRKGVRKVTEDELIASLEITPNKFYGMFRNKADLLEQAVISDLERQKSVHREILEGAKNAVEELMGLLKAGADEFTQISPEYISDVLKHYPRIVQIGTENTEDYAIPLYAEILNRGIEQKLFRRDININIVTRVIMENVYVLVNYRAFPPEKYSTGEVLRSIYLYYFRGLCEIDAARQVDEYFAQHSF